MDADTFIIDEDILAKDGSSIISAGEHTCTDIENALNRYELSYGSIFEDTGAFSLLFGIHMNEQTSVNIGSLCFVADKLVTRCSDCSRFKDIESFDKGIAEHCINVARYAVMIGIYMQLPQVAIEELAMGAVLHDYGKLFLPRRILDKPDDLSTEEYEIVKRHPQLGVDALKDDSSISDTVIEIVRQHHENYDGSGYPLNLSYNRIHLLARIVRICDSFDALLSKRSYKKKITKYKVWSIINDDVGASYDPHIYSVFELVIPIYSIYEILRFSDGSKALVISQSYYRDNPILLTKYGEMALKEYLDKIVYSSKEYDYQDYRSLT